MVITTKAATLFDGETQGKLLKLQAPICFWGGLDAATGRISDPKHPDHGKNVTGKILTLPSIVGSSSSSQILLELLLNQKQPKAIILGEADAIIAMAVLVGREMGFGTIPILQGRIDQLTTGQWLEIKNGGHVIIKDEQRDG